MPPLPMAAGSPKQVPTEGRSDFPIAYSCRCWLVHGAGQFSYESENFFGDLKVIREHFII